MAAPLLRPNIDTDAIIPSREMKRVSKVGLSDGLFAGERYINEGGRLPAPDFVLNKPAYQGCSIILAGSNFGCGSSREHAVWALKEYGIRCIVAESFGAIFANNCVRNGLLPVVLELEPIRAISKWVDADPQAHQVTADLESQTVQWGADSLAFDAEPGARYMLLNGLDAIALTQTRQEQIMRFHERRKQSRPWLYGEPVPDS